MKRCSPCSTFCFYYIRSLNLNKEYAVSYWILLTSKVQSKVSKWSITRCDQVCPCPFWQNTGTWSVSVSAVATETISFILNSQHSYSLMRIGEPPKCSNNGDITRRLTKNDQRNNLNFYVTIKTMNMNIYHSKCYFGWILSVLLLLLWHWAHLLQT